MRWPETVKVPKRIVKATNDWAAKLCREYGYVLGSDLEDDASGMSNLTVSVVGSGLGDLYFFEYKTFKASAFIDDDNKLVFKEEL